MTRREWCFAGVSVLALTLAAVVIFSDVQLQDLTPNPAYSSVYAALITAPAILFGAWIAYRALRLNHENQLSPNRLELYKRQIDVFGAICLQTRRVRRLAVALGELRDAPLTERQGHIARLIRAAKKLISRLDDNVLLLTEDVGACAGNVWLSAVGMVTAMRKEKPDPEVVIGHQVNIDLQTDDVIGACVEIIAPEHLSDGWREMIATHRKHLERIRPKRRPGSPGNENAA